MLGAEHTGRSSYARTSTVVTPLQFKIIFKFMTSLDPPTTHTEGQSRNHLFFFTVKGSSKKLSRLAQGHSLGTVRT